MTEQEVLNKIKESADFVEIPEGLKPEQIELKLKEGKKPEKFRWQAMHLVAAAIVLVLMLGFVPLGLNMGNKDCELAEEAQQNATAWEDAEEVVKVEKQDVGDLYVVAKSYEEVYEFMRENAELNRKYNGTVYDLEMSGGEAISDEATESVSVESKLGDLQYSTTNLQMEGVDESDIVKTNGSHIFIVKDDAVRIVQIDNGEMKQIGEIAPELESFSDSVREMYVDGDMLMLIVQQVKENLESTNTTESGGGLLPLYDETNGLCVDMIYNYDVSYSTVLYTYDISNPTSPKQVGKMEQDGFYKTSRKIDDMMYLFTQDSILMETELLTGAEDEIAKLLPTVNGEAVAYDCVYLPKSGNQGLVVSSVSLNNPNEVVDNILILNDYVDIYVSNSAMYLYNAEYSTDIVHTQIAKFSLKKGQISAVAAATVPGTILDTFSINEQDGNLRVLTSYWDSSIGDRTNQLYILDASLKAAGKIEEIAPGEMVYATRYFGDLAYFITYRNTDPLFVADLSDINNPKILGELEITGYSEYLHMWGEDKLLGIGYETDPDNVGREGIKLVMFDISNPEELCILDTVVLKDADYSAALFNYKCVMADANKNMIGFITAEYADTTIDYHVYSFADGKFTEELVIEGKSRVLGTEESYRGLWAGNYFYMVNPSGIKSFNYVEDYKAIDELEIED